MGGINKFGQDQRSRVLDDVDGVPVADLRGPVRLPAVRLFGAHAGRALPRARTGVRAPLPPRANRLVVQDQLSAGDLPRVPQLGAWAEVVSPFEYDKALRGGIPPERIHFNGPFKPDDALARAIDGGSFLHVDGFDEIARIERVAKRLGKTARVAVRVNMSLDGVPSWSRFGLNLESGQAARGGRAHRGRRRDGPRRAAHTHRHVHARSHVVQDGGGQARAPRQRAQQPARRATVVHRHGRGIPLTQHAQGAISRRRPDQPPLHSVRARRSARDWPSSSTRRSICPPWCSRPAGRWSTRRAAC